MIRTGLKRGEVDRAVMYGVVANVWSLLSAPVTMLFITARFTPVLQGFYYTFSSLLALQVFVELGLGNVLVQFTSHEWSKLGLNAKGEIVGEPEALSRLVSLGRIAFRWYLAAGALVAIGVSTGGYVFFSESRDPGIYWTFPWIVLCGLSGMNLWLTPALSLLEGCNQIQNLYGFRVARSILNSVSIWISISSGAGLWTAAITTAVGIVVSIIFIFYRYRCFFGPFVNPPSGSRISWTTEIWPMQWRIALSWLSGYFIFSLFTPVLFHYHGAIAAGRMGMTWGLVSCLGNVSSIWIMSRAPQFGMLIAAGKYQDLDQLFFKIVKISTLTLALGAIILFALVYLLNLFGYPLSQRLLSPLPTALFLFAHSAMTISSYFAVYLRAHKKEPFLILSLISAFLISLSTWLLGRSLGEVGVAVGYTSVCIFFVLPYGLAIWSRYRSLWHGTK